MAYIPGPDDAFETWQKNFIEYAEAHAGTMKIPPEGVASLKASQQAFEAALAKFKDPNHGKLDTAAKNDAKNAYIQAIRDFVKGYLYNPAVSETDRRSLGVPPERHAPATPAPDPETVPEAEVQLTLIRWLVIHFRDKGGKSKAKPHGIHGAEIRWGLAENPIKDPEEMPHSDFDTASPFKLEFKDQERGKTVYFALRWENTRGRKGPWSEVYSAIVP
ncbi:MAG: hypothetical protein LBG87_00045 [Spirochaetaceae bacterium]|jgi:hypothetical protein|nr:hypothetical protein [Spirochaetaceae bacterium]